MMDYTRPPIGYPMSERQHLENRARELGCFPDPENYTNRQLMDAIMAEQAGAEWLDRLEQLPTDEAKRAAVHRLRLLLEKRARLSDD